MSSVVVLGATFATLIAAGDFGVGRHESSDGGRHEGGGGVDEGAVAVAAVFDVENVELGREGLRTANGGDRQRRRVRRRQALRCLHKNKIM